MEDGEAGFVAPPFFSPSFLFSAPDEKDTSVHFNRSYRPGDRRTPPLERGFERRGLRMIAAEQVGLGTYYLAKRG